MKEIWKPIESHEGIYEISNLGRAKSLERPRKKIGGFVREKILKQNVSSSGHMNIHVKIDGEQISYSTGRLVLKTFIGIAKDGTICWHKDRNLTNNNLDNLEWISIIELTQRTPRPSCENHARTKLTNIKVEEIKNDINAGMTISELKNKYDVDKGILAAIKGERTWLCIDIPITNKPKETKILSEIEASEIKKRINKGETFRSIALDYPVSMWAIGGIKRGGAWAHVKPYIKNKPKSQFTKSDVIEIIKMLNDGIMQKEIAKIYNVSRVQISHIKLGKSWRRLSHLIDDHIKNTHGNTLRFENRQ